MKKILSGLIVASSLLASTAFAAGAVTAVDANQIDTTKCVLLDAPVKVNLSANVSGVYQCNDTDNSIRIATCHSSGSRSGPKELACAQIGKDATTNKAIYNGGTACETDPAAKFTVPVSFSGFAASSTGGSIGEVPLTGKCDTTELKKQTVFSY
ncbi:conserved exported hypothetical protein [Pseudomonas sp. OF001]|uniref:hypothetical protein n=1 Tax=Pseudomonas sp. OF001 TaxID=2772300 RepID=UPI00191B8386|nr:hypothetical protein [Pseudomonas sp. OF001]CAD5375585.1 conserved exported hypothetical protein [Pseudomonas sp. OF001]